MVNFNISKPSQDIWTLPSPVAQSVAWRTLKQEVAGSIPGSANILLLLSIVSTMVMWESSQWLGKNIVRSTG